MRSGLGSVKIPIWGRAQPETVRDYIVEWQGDEGGWHPWAEVAGNHQRLVMHRLDRPVGATALRIGVHATNGLDHARLCEVRAYETAD